MEEQRQRYVDSVAGAFSRSFAAALFEALPHFQQYAWMIESAEPDGLSLDLEVPSPTSDEARQLVVWVDEVITPSIEFGPTHTHRSPDAAGIAEVVELARAILADQILILEEVCGEHPGYGTWIDLRDPDELLDELTSPYSPGKALLKSWSGLADREVDTENV